MLIESVSQQNQDMHITSFRCFSSSAIVKSQVAQEMPHSQQSIDRSTTHLTPKTGRQDDVGAITKAGGLLLVECIADDEQMLRPGPESAWALLFIPALLSYVCMLSAELNRRPTLGTVERLDAAALAVLLAPDAVLEVIADGSQWAEGPVWVHDHEEDRGCDKILAGWHVACLIMVDRWWLIRADMLWID